MNTPLKYTLNIFQTAAEFNAAAAAFIIAAAKEAVTARGRFVISLSGGQTPNGVYSLLAKSTWHEQIDWIKTFVFWSDERYVRFDDDRNNARQATSIFLSRIDIPATNIYAINVNVQPDEAAKEYENGLTAFFGNAALRFDLVLLGLGENGHTASLFQEQRCLMDSRKACEPSMLRKKKCTALPLMRP